MNVSWAYQYRWVPKWLNDARLKSISKLASSKSKVSDCPINTHVNIHLPQGHKHFSALPWTSVETGLGPATDDSRAEKSSTMQYQCIKETKKPHGFLSWQQRPSSAVAVNRLTRGYLGTERYSCMLMWGQGTSLHTFILSQQSKNPTKQYFQYFKHKLLKWQEKNLRLRCPEWRVYFLFLFLENKVFSPE